MKQSAIQKLKTEARNRAARDLDRKSARDIARIINKEDAKVAAAVRKTLPQISKAIDAIATRLKQGGRLIYVGCGTSGRIAALDASECPPTFGVSPETVQYVIAGGDSALGMAAEYNEDSRDAGIADLAARNPGKNDVIVGIAASGRTPYTVAAIEYARKQGAYTVAVVCNKGSQLGKAADLAIVTEVGPEVVSGSTRMKAGTAQKMVLNLLSTGAMTRLGYVYGNLMVNVHTRNEKLVERGIGILMEAAGVERVKASTALRAAEHSVPVALIMLKTGLDRVQAEQILKAAGGHVRSALARPKSK